MEFIRHKDAKQVIICLSVAVAYLVEHTLTITEVCGSNPGRVAM